MTDALTSAGDVITWTREGGSPPLFVEPATDDLRSPTAFVAWFERNAGLLGEALDTHGAVVLRGFPIRTTADFNDLIEVLGPWEANYAGGASLRSRIDGAVYETTRVSPAMKIGMHQEMNYLAEAPGRLAFFCAKPADRGGETLIADMRRFTREIPPDLYDRFARLGTRIVRNFVAPPADGSTEEAGLHPDQRSWVTAFYTDDRAEVERECARKSLTPIWHDDGSLSVETAFPILMTHPRTGEEVYRGVVHFHPDDYADAAQVPEQVRQKIDELLARQRIPSGYMLGDGSVLAPHERHPLARRIEELETYWDWQAGDLMIIDNLLVAHGRNPFEGSRDVQVALLA